MFNNPFNNNQQQKDDNKNNPFNTQSSIFNNNQQQKDDNKNNPFNTQSSIFNNQLSINNNQNPNQTFSSPFSSTPKTNPFDNSQLNASFTGQKETNNPFNTQTAGLSNTTQGSTILDDNIAHTDSNASGFVSSIKDNSINLYNLTLKEIVEKQTAILDKNIKEFKKSAKEVFEQDMRLIRAKNNYIKIQNKIAQEKARMDELLEGLEFFENELDKYDLKEDNKSENAKIVHEFEQLGDKFYEQVENFHDENNGVMDLINENYDLLDQIDGRLDELEMRASE
ncbi:hypothetical protein NUSPORA_01480 [Nucleospora cyclopteri]